MIRNHKKTCGIAISEIFLIVLSIFSFSFIIGELEIVSAQTAPESSQVSTTNTPTQTTSQSNNAGVGAAGTAAGAGASGAGKAGGGLFGGLFGSLLQGLMIAGLVGGMAYFIAQSLGESDKGASAIGLAVGGGVFTYYLLAQTLGLGIGISALVGLGVGVAILYFLYEKEKTRIVQFQCLPFEAPLGGEDCEICNENEFRPCSEYRCRSLGQACELVNEGTEEERCVWVSRDDAKSTTITPWDEALTEGHSYTKHDARPPALGTKIIKNGATNGCLQAFTPLEFGILTDEPAQCKIDTVHTEKFDDMKFLFGESNFYLEEHKQKLNLPSPDAINTEAPELQNDGIYDFYVRCRDRNGNENVDEFIFNLCVDPSPDTTPPIIVDTSIISESPVAFGASEIDVDVYINEPAECKWSIQDKNYEDMENSMVCSTKVNEINAQLLYTCSTTLNGIKDRELNTYYFRCKDQPKKPENERNVNVQSYKFVLRGTEPLNIINVGPNGTISDNTDLVNVELSAETSNGADEGVAICYFSDNGEEGSYIEMFETRSFEHKQILSLPSGDYTFYFRCVDAGGNSDEETTSFTVFVDRESPMITRVYRELDALKIVTDEDAQCVYSLNNCNFNFEEGVALIYSNSNIKTNHFAPWKPNLAYYIKCRDFFGNEPNPDECSLIASASNIV